MTSLRQIAANQLNARHSTGPKTDHGKRRSRRNALRHGLTAETVIEIFEDIADYEAFEANVIGDYDAQTAVERELVLRLASLLWRIRRATAIETDLLRIQAEGLHDRQLAIDRNSDESPLRIPEPAIPLAVGGWSDDTITAINSNEAEGDAAAETLVEPFRGLTHCFLRLANLDNAVFDRLADYQARLWRQTIQTLAALRWTRQPLVPHNCDFERPLGARRRPNI
jgi:hypothetical protein